jgi:hypothetical protein
MDAQDKFGAPAFAETPINHPDRVSRSTNSTRAGRTQEGTSMLKKITLLAMAVGALVAFAAPASALAATDWTHNGSVVSEPVDLTETFEGELRFFAGVSDSFGCQVTVKATVTGPTSAELTEFNPTTSSCSGTGKFAGCVLIADSNNAPWTVTNGATTLSVTKTGGNVTVFNEYEAGCSEATSHLEFTSVTVTPTLNGSGVITKLTISGTATNGAVAAGSVEPEVGTTLLGLE